MRLESLCRMSMRYLGASWHRPYGALSDSEGLGFGHGDGEVTGAIEGRLVWANYPRRRQDGVWAPNLRGMITGADDKELVVSDPWPERQEDAPGHRRAILARVELLSEAEPYRWLSTASSSEKGRSTKRSKNWWLDTYVCVSEQAQGLPAIGAEPPERFRQSGLAR